MIDNISEYLSGKKLYGDNFTIDEIEKWFIDETEGYANLGAKEKDEYRYAYHHLNQRHGFKFIHNRYFNEALGIGSAFGDEFEPISDKVRSISILEPSDAFAKVNKIAGIPCVYYKPNSAGNMPFKNNQFDLILCLGVMHHIPNVSQVMSECYRCLNYDGIMLLREPIISMGNWTMPRKGLTKRERGIPIKILKEIVTKLGFRIIHESPCNFPLIPKIAVKIGVLAYNNFVLTLIDALLSQAFFWNIKYHRTKLFEKFAPASIYYILEKKL